MQPQNIQRQQEFIQMNGQTLMVPCGTTQNIAASSAQNQQNTTYVQQNTTIVQQQTTMVSNNQIPGLQAVGANNQPSIEHPAINVDPNQPFILSAGMVTVIKFYLLKISFAIYINSSLNNRANRLIFNFSGEGLQFTKEQ